MTREEILADQLRSALSALRDLDLGYSWRELHIDLDTMLDAARDAGVELDEDEDEEDDEDFS